MLPVQHEWQLVLMPPCGQKMSIINCLFQVRPLKWLGLTQHIYLSNTTTFHYKCHYNALAKEHYKLGASLAVYSAHDAIERLKKITYFTYFKLFSYFQPLIRITAELQNQNATFQNRHTYQSTLGNLVRVISFYPHAFWLGVFVLFTASGVLQYSCHCTDSDFQATRGKQQLTQIHRLFSVQ